MKAIIAKHGSKADVQDAFKLIEQPAAEVGQEDLLVKVIAIGMNPVDTKIRQRATEDRVLGWDVCGVVTKTGSETKGFKPGDKVFYAGDITRPGCNSEFHLVNYKIAAIAPQKLTCEDAAAMPLTSITAWEGLFDRLGFISQKGANQGQSILIIGGAGGVGSVLIQLAKWAGLKVYATASRPETVAWCKKLGADHTLNHHNQLDEELKKINQDTVDAIFCTTQLEKHWSAMAEMIKPQGKIVFIDDPVNNLDLRIFKLKSVSLCWEFMYTRSMFQTKDMANQGKLLSKIAQLLDEGSLIATRQKTWRGLTVDNIQSMHITQESGSMIGKQVLVC